MPIDGAANLIVNMDVPVDKKHLVCIEYPGIVVNTDQMLKSLGGEHNISKVVKCCMYCIKS